MNEFGVNTPRLWRIAESQAMLDEGLDCIVQDISSGIGSPTILYPMLKPHSSASSSRICCVSRSKGWWCWTRLEHS
jgi:hypothetical protein